MEFQKVVPVSVGLWCRWCGKSWDVKWVEGGVLPHECPGCGGTNPTVESSGRNLGALAAVLRAATEAAEAAERWKALYPGMNLG